MFERILSGAGHLTSAQDPVGVVQYLTLDVSGSTQEPLFEFSVTRSLPPSSLSA